MRQGIWSKPVNARRLKEAAVRNAVRPVQPAMDSNRKGIGEVVHRYKNNGYNIVLDVNSGSVHVVDDIVYDLIGAAEKLSEKGRSAWMEEIANLDLPYDKEEIREAAEEIFALKEAGTLFAPDIYETYVGDFKKRETVVKALCLHVAHDCNLACRYCFAEEGEYHGRRALMSYETGKKALDFLVANSGNRVNLEVDFFGGEPAGGEGTGGLWKEPGGTFP